MRKLFVLLILLVSAGVVFSEEETQTLEPVHLNLDEDVQSINAEKERINTEKLEFQKYFTPESGDTQKYDEPDTYSKKTSSFTKEKQINDKMTVGAKSDTTFAPESAQQTGTLYSKYNLTDKVSVNTSYKNNTLEGLTNRSKGTVAVAPEYRINKHVLLKNMFGRDFGNKSNKSELQLNVQPFQDDRMDLSVGAGQVQRDNSGASSSQVNFGTNFKF